jgi:biopolymer transport protein TolR
MARRSSHSRLKAEMNVVPYIDVMLVLLVIFMVTAPLLNQGVEVDLPQVAMKPTDLPDQQTETVVLSVRRDGSCYLNVGSENAQPVECLRLVPRRDAIVALLKRVPQPPVLVRADKEVRYEQVIQAMAALKEAGATKVQLSTAPPDESPRP